MSKQILPGWKNSTLGNIPSDWNVFTLEQITDPRRPIGYGIVQTGRSVLNGIKCIRVIDIQNGRVNPDHLITTSEEISASYKRTLLSEGDLVIALRGKIGALAIIDRQLAGANLTRGVALLAPQSGYNGHYLHQFLSSSKGMDILEKSMNGSALQEIPISSLRKIAVIVPPIVEQEAIAASLSDMDALISGLDQLIAKKRDIKQATMQKLLTGQVRLPGFSGEWKVRRIGTLLTFQVGFPFSSDFFEDGLHAIRLIKNRDLKSDDSPVCFIGPYDEGYIVKNGDLLVGMDGDFMPCLWGKGEALLNQRVGRIVPGEGISAAFCYYAIREPLKKIELSTGATTVKHLSHSDVEAIEIRLPEIDEQNAIAAILSDMDAELDVIEVRREKAKQLKQGMMHELLTGRIRLLENT